MFQPLENVPYRSLNASKEIAGPCHVSHAFISQLAIFFSGTKTAFEVLKVIFDNDL